MIMKNCVVFLLLAKRKTKKVNAPVDAGMFQKTQVTKKPDSVKRIHKVITDY